MSSDNYFTFVLTETLALANGGGSATSEVLRLASQIVPGDFDGWFSEYDWMGDQMYALAQRAKTSISKRGALFRAASYWRLSGFFLTGNASDPRLYEKWDLGLDAFSEAISLLPVPGENHTISGPEYSIPYYFYKASECNEKLPTIVVGTGYDGPQQDVWHQLGQEATSRGYNFVTYEGPGQPTVRRHDNIGFIPNWWDVVTPIIDEISSRADVDMDNLAYIGVSFGGELAPRVASREHRFKAVISIDGLVDMQEAILSQLPEELVEAFESNNATLFDEAMTYALSVPPRNTEFTWVTGQGLWSFNTTSYYDWLTQLGTFKVTQELVNNITTPYLFVAEGEDDSLAPGQPLALVSLYGNATEPLNTTYYRFPTNLGAGEHCQLGAEPQLAQEVYDWLYGIF
ncbi:putative Alpha/Beta hydrolase protein [Seiridium cardinale]|uniref:Alpha/Beta hydrolase protein n=1 Tax=Seiridium cardinale TaxID=138064 RepID=A0ABR2XR24_9PEZI